MTILRAQLHSRPIGRALGRGATAAVAGIALLGPLSISSYFPSFPAIAGTFGAPAGDVRLTLSLYLLGFCVGQLIYGPASDAVGRRPAMLVGTTLFAVASIGCCLATSITILIVARLAQGLGACAGVVLGRAIARDRLDGIALTRMLALIALTSTAAPMFGPALGGAIQTWFGWRATFGVLAALGVAAVIATIAALPETRPPNPDAGPALTMGARLGLLAYDRQFLLITASAGLVTAHVYIWGAGAPTFFMNRLGFTPAQYGLLGLLTAIGNFSVNLLLVTKRLTMTPATLASLGTAGIALTGFALLVVCLAGWWTNPTILLAPIVMASAFAGMANVGLAGLALADRAAVAGTASALLGAGQMATGALGTSLLALDTTATPLPIAIPMVITAVAAVATTAAARRRRGKPE